MPTCSSCGSSENTHRSKRLKNGNMYYHAKCIPCEEAARNGIKFGDWGRYRWPLEFSKPGEAAIAQYRKIVGIVREHRIHGSDEIADEHRAGRQTGITAKTTRNRTDGASDTGRFRDVVQDERGETS